MHTEAFDAVGAKGSHKADSRWLNNAGSTLTCDRCTVGWLIGQLRTGGLGQGGASACFTSYNPARSKG